MIKNDIIKSSLTVFILPFFFILFSVLIVSAEDNSTTFKDLGLYGGQVNAIAVNPDNPSLLFAGTWMGDGLFKSIDAGETWITIPGFRNQERIPQK